MTRPHQFKPAALGYELRQQLHYLQSPLDQVHGHFFFLDFCEENIAKYTSSLSYSAKASLSLRDCLKISLACQMITLSQHILQIQEWRIEHTRTRAYTYYSIPLIRIIPFLKCKLILTEDGWVVSSLCCGWIDVCYSSTASTCTTWLSFQDFLFYFILHHASFISSGKGTHTREDWQIVPACICVYQLMIFLIRPWHSKIKRI